MTKKTKDVDIVLMKRALGLALVSIRKKRGLQQQEVAAQAETSRAHLSDMEHGRGDPKFSMMLRISQVLRVRFLVLATEIVRQYNGLRQDADWDDRLR